MLRHATIGDIDEIVRIAEETKNIMHAQGNVQWDEIYPLRADFERDIEQGTFYIIEENRAVAGFVCLDSDEPEVYMDVDWQKTGPALILHRMAVDPQLRGTGIGGKLLTFAQEKATEIGACSIRTDTFSGNAAMNALFIKHGFRMAGVIDLPFAKKQPFYCYEK